jgi:hypothetical protein
MSLLTATVIVQSPPEQGFVAALAVVADEAAGAGVVSEEAADPPQAAATRSARVPSVRMRRFSGEIGRAIVRTFNCNALGM